MFELEINLEVLFQKLKTLLIDVLVYLGQRETLQMQDAVCKCVKPLADVHSGLIKAFC